MDLNDFIEKTQDFLSSKFSGVSFNLEDANQFAPITEPYTISGKRYQIYAFKALTGFLPNKNRQEPLKYSFFVLRPLDGVKEKYLEEVNKMHSGREYDKNIISDYYAPFVPAFEEFKVLTDSLSQMLSNDYFQGRGYNFVFNMVQPDKDFDLVLIFIETDSMQALTKIYPDKVQFDPQG